MRPLHTVHIHILRVLPRSLMKVDDVCYQRLHKGWVTMETLHVHHNTPQCSCLSCQHAKKKKKANAKRDTGFVFLKECFMFMYDCCPHLCLVSLEQNKSHFPVIFRAGRFSWCQVEQEENKERGKGSTCNQGSFTASGNGQRHLGVPSPPRCLVHCPDETVFSSRRNQWDQWTLTKMKATNSRSWYASNYDFS